MPLGARVVPGGLAFALADPDHDLSAVRLWTDVSLGSPPPEVAMRRDRDAWTLTIPTPPVDRLEYLYIATAFGQTVPVVEPGDDAPAGHEQADDEQADDEQAPSDPAPDAPQWWLVDPANARRVGGAFGDHSEVRLPGYRPPAWLDAPTVAAERLDHRLDTVAGPIDVQVWAPSSLAADESAPLLLAHDGPEFDAFAGLTLAVGAAIARGALPPLRVGLLAPGPRDERYAANDDYARALATQVVPALLERHPASEPPALLGASLGALAALHAHWRHPGAFGALALASGSFFTPELDPQESGYGRWAQITGFVAQVAAAGPGDDAARRLPPIAMVAGTAEENLANNERMRDQLRGLGGEVSWVTAADGHCYTCWRDLLDPAVVELLARAWQPGSGRQA